jgi:hypothetical protein
VLDAVPRTGDVGKETVNKCSSTLERRDLQT